MKLDSIPQMETSVVNDVGERMNGEQASGLMDVWGVCVKRKELSFAGAAILLGMDSARTLLLI